MGLTWRMIVIVGGGISGLSVGYFLHRLGISSLILEKASRPGGVIFTSQTLGALAEEGPNSLLADPLITNLINELGLSAHVVNALPANKDRYILKNGRYKKLPANPIELLTSNFFSIRTKIKILQELSRKPGIGSHELLYNFFVDHFGEEVADYALVPFVSGIYAGDAKKLLVEETFPSLKKFEEESGSVLKGLIKNAGSRKTTFNFTQGLGMLPHAMAKHVKIQYNAAVKNIDKLSDGFQVHYSTDYGMQTVYAMQLIVCLPAKEASSILQDSFPKASECLLKIEYPPMSVVYTTYKKTQVALQIQGFGGLHPKKEDSFSAGGIWSSFVFPGRCNESELLYTTFVGGSLYTANALLPADTIKEKVHQELKRHFKIEGSPVGQEVKHWPYAIPQYTKALLPLKIVARNLEKDNLYICSNIMNGVSVSDCIKKGYALASRLAVIHQEM